MLGGGGEQAEGHSVAEELRPRGALELADAAVDLLATHRGAVVVAAGPALALGAAAGSGAALLTDANPFAIAAVALPFAAAAHAVTVAVVAPAVIGAARTSREAWQSVGAGAGQLLLALLVAGPLVAGGTVLLVVPGLFLAARYSLVAAVVLLEPRTGAVTAFRRGSALARPVRGSLRLLMVAALVAGVLAAGVVAQLAMLGTGLSGARADGGRALAAAAGIPVGLGVAVVVAGAASAIGYVDARVRDEGLDILFLVRRAREAAAAAIAGEAAAAERR